MQKYIDWHALWIFIIIVAGQAFSAAYPYINPANPQWLTAIQTVVMVILLAIYQHGRVTTKQQIKVVESTLVQRVKFLENRAGVGDTQSTPVPPRSSLGDYDRHG